MTLEPAIIHLLEDQAGAANRRQLLARGYTGGQIDGLLRHGHLTRDGHGVYRRPGSPRTPEQEAVVATLRCGPGARVAGRRLLGLLGVEGCAPDDPFIVLLRPGRRVRNVPYRLGRDLAPQRHHARFGAVLGTTPARSLLEEAATMDDDAWLGLFDRCRWRGVVTTDRLLRVITDVDSHPSAARVLRLLDAPGDQESHGERGLQQIVVAVPQLPPLEWQVWLAPGLRADALWRDCALVLEYQGAATHEDERDIAADEERHDRIRALGYGVVVVTRHDLRHPVALRGRLSEARRRRFAELRAHWTGDAKGTTA